MENKCPTLQELTLSEKISQLLMVKSGSLMYKRDEGKVKRRSDEEVEAIMEKYQYGSIWAYAFLSMDIVNMAESGRKASIQEHKEWIDLVRRKVRLPMLVGMDAESGTGNTFCDGTRTGTGFTVGAADSEELTYDLCAGIVREVKAAGGNWCWSPVVDQPNRFSSGLARPYSTESETLCRLSIAAMRGMNSENVISAAKHFPGADPYEYRDGHFVPTQINISVEEWEQGQGKIFQTMIDAGIPSVMVGHAAFPAVDDTMVNGRYLPATCSEKIIKGLLREKMGFDGVVITDAVDMAGLSTFGTHEEILVRCINAGNDILLGVDEYDFDIVYQAVIDGRISMERIDESCERVLKLKEKYGLFKEEREEIDLEEARRKTTEANRKIAEKSITLLYDKNELLPLSTNKVTNVTILCSSHNSDTIHNLEVMKEEFGKRGARARIVEFAGLSKEELIRYAQEEDLIIYAAYVAMHQPFGMPTLYGEQLLAYGIAFSYGNEKSMGLSMGYPYLHYDIMQGANTFVNIYSDSPESQKAFVKALYGEIPFEGKSPVDIEPKMRYLLC